MSRELLAQALDAWDCSFGTAADAARLGNALRAALAQQQAEPVADPFTYIIQHLNSSTYNLTKDECIHFIKELRTRYATPQQAQPTPAPSNQLSGNSGTLSDDDLLRIATTLGLPFGMLDTDYCKSMEIEPGTRTYGEVTCSGMVRFARAVLGAQPAPAAPVPAGWVMVPVEPTLDMQMSALEMSRAASGIDYMRPLPMARELWASAEVYHAMIAAAPAAPAVPAVQPLSGDVLYALWASENGLEDCEMCKLNDFTKAARFFERAHGIAAPGSADHG